MGAKGQAMIDALMNLHQDAELKLHEVASVALADGFLFMAEERYGLVVMLKSTDVPVEVDISPRVYEQAELFDEIRNAVDDAEGWIDGIEQQVKARRATLDVRE